MPSVKHEGLHPDIDDTLDYHLDALASLAEAVSGSNEPSTLVLPRTSDDLIPDSDSSDRDLLQARVPLEKRVPRAVVPGYHNASYHVPEIRFRSFMVLPLMIAILLLVTAVSWRLTNGAGRLLHPALIVAAPLLALRAYGWVLSAFDRPHKVETGSPEAQHLDSLNVAVTVPCYNEDEGLLDRCLWALVNQTRAPQRIDLVNDGSNKVAYSKEFRAHWTGQHGDTLVTWHDQENMGKRRAHYHLFVSDPEADVFITVDSDTTVLLNGVDEILKPFADPRVQSVAGIELGFNAKKNILTVVQNSLQQVAQLAISASWSVSGRMFTNRGPFAAYRAPMMRKIADLYWGETFYGHRILLGDDSLGALAGSVYGKAIQQLSAFGLTMWPETGKHMWNQRLRWARGRTIRTFWRLKYYPVFSYLWWFSLASVYALFTNLYLTYIIVTRWPESAHLTERLIVAAILLGWISQFRVLTLRREDDTWLDRLLLIGIRPAASLFAAIVLARVIRLLGTLTCLKQGWTTRKQGAELRLLQNETEKT